MNRARLIRLSARLANSVNSTQHPTPNSLSLTQVTHFSNLIQYPVHFSKKPYTYYDKSPFTLQYLFFSSKPESFIDIVLSNDWSEEIKNELEKSDPKLTHESIVYVLMKSRKDPQKALAFFKWACNEKGFKPSSVLYNILLRILAGKDFMDQFWGVAWEMKGKGFCVDKQTYLTSHGILKQEKLVKEKATWIDFYKKMCRDYARNNNVAENVVDVILGSDWTEKVEGKLKEMIKFPLSENFLLTVFSDLWPQPSRALKFFDWLGHCRGYEHNAVTYNEMAKVLGQRESMEMFWDLVKRMRSEGYEMDTNTYVKISRNLRNGDAVDLFEFMMDGPYKPSEHDCTMLLKNLSFDMNPDMDLVFRVIKRYEAAGYTLTKAIYDGIHRSLCKVGRFDEAKKLLEDMKNAGYKPDNITYSQEIHGLCKLKRFEEAWKVLEQMEAEGCVPDVKTWTILIQGYQAAGLLDEALLCCEKMTRKKIDPDADVLDVFINGFLSQNKLLGAYTTLIEMVNKAPLRPWQATYKLMIEKLLKVGKLEEALNLLSMMKQHNYPPYSDPFVQYFAKSGSVEDATKFIKALPVKGTPSTKAYVRVIKSFLNEGRHSEAQDLLYKSPHQVRTSKKITSLFGSVQNKSRTPMSFVKDEGPDMTPMSFMKDAGPDMTPLSFVK